MTGANILPRDVIVWLPPGYSENSAKRYPVLYMHDGQNLFDPKTASFGVDWQIDETADSLIRNGIISELIIVAYTAQPTG
jgi:predicted alpha/beta superfamily hydrolase